MVIGFLLVCCFIACIEIPGEAPAKIVPLESIPLDSSQETDGTLSPVQGTLDTVIMETGFPKAMDMVPLYRVSSVDVREDYSNDNSKIKRNIPTAQEAPALAEKALESYGGHPNDAKLVRADPLYRVKYNVTSRTAEERYPVSTQVRYIQAINGVPVYRTGINLMLGEHGEILNIYKNWITSYEEIPGTPIITAAEGFEKLRQGKTTAKLQGDIPQGTRITSVEFGYYYDKESSDVLKPVWVYTARVDPEMEPFKLYVDATR